jgi:hypothetical protein
MRLGAVADQRHPTIAFQAHPQFGRSGCTTTVDQGGVNRCTDVTTPTPEPTHPIRRLAPLPHQTSDSDVETTDADHPLVSSHPPSCTSAAATSSAHRYPRYAVTRRRRSPSWSQRPASPDHRQLPANPMARRGNATTSTNAACGSLSLDDAR